MINYTDLYATLEGTPLEAWLATLPQQINAGLEHGDLAYWKKTLRCMPSLVPGHIDLDIPCPQIGTREEIDHGTHTDLHNRLLELSPWRKGPFSIFGIHIDSEWRADWKWARVIPHISPLAGRRVLDVGCGNGYYGWRMLGAGAHQVIGIDPTALFTMQYLVLRHFIGPQPLHVLPLRFEDMPEESGLFDTVFSMGVFYHRKDPQEHFQRLHGHLKPGGELVLEGLVIEGGPGDVLLPAGRYAKMRNVWRIPSPPTLASWLQQSGFTDIVLADLTATTTAEQRSTPWMRFESLRDFLDPDDPRRTVEGYPAPLRAIFTAKRPVAPRCR